MTTTFADAAVEVTLAELGTGNTVINLAPGGMTTIEILLDITAPTEISNYGFSVDWDGGPTALLGASNLVHTPPIPPFLFEPGPSLIINQSAANTPGLAISCTAAAFFPVANLSHSVGTIKFTALGPTGSTTVDPILQPWIDGFFAPGIFPITPILNGVEIRVTAPPVVGAN